MTIEKNSLAELRRAADKELAEAKRAYQQAEKKHANKIAAFDNLASVMGAEQPGNSDEKATSKQQRRKKPKRARKTRRLVLVTEKAGGMGLKQSLLAAINELPKTFNFADLLQKARKFKPNVSNRDVSSALYRIVKEDKLLVVKEVRRGGSGSTYEKAN